MSVKTHYNSHLGKFYEWMVGDFDSKQKEEQAFFVRNGVIPHDNRIAVDLGSAHGIQSISLANLGFSVKAIDFNKTLLRSLIQRAGNLDIQAIEDDLLSFTNYIHKAELVVCMGDTIAHLPGTEELSELFHKTAYCLSDNGKLVVSYRDYSMPLTGTDRFIPVKSDEHRIFTCFLEFIKDKVSVTDLLYEKEDSGWKQKASSYLKLRLTPGIVEDLIEDAGFEITSRESINRMNYLIGKLSN